MEVLSTLAGNAGSCQGAKACTAAAAAVGEVAVDADVVDRRLPVVVYVDGVVEDAEVVEDARVVQDVSVVDGAKGCL